MLSPAPQVPGDADYLVGGAPPWALAGRGEKQIGITLI